MWNALQLAVHAIGDRAVDEVVAAYKRAHQVNGRFIVPRRHRVEHAQHLSGVKAIENLAKGQHVVVSNPLHVLSDRDVLVERLGTQRATPTTSFAFRALQEVSWRGLPAELPDYMLYLGWCSV